MLSTDDFDTIVAMLDDADTAQVAAFYAAAGRRLARHQPPERRPIGHFTFDNPRISPRYLNGLTVPVFKENDASYKADVPDTAEFRTWRGRKGIRIPKTLGRFEAV